MRSLAETACLHFAVGIGLSGGSGMAAKKKAASKGFTAEEREAMKERVREMKAAGSKADGEKEVLSKIAQMPAADRALAQRVHAIVKAAAPSLSAKTWYGMPAYARDGEVVTRRWDSATKRSWTKVRCGRRRSR
jgi:hypothetical protein